MWPSHTLVTFILCGITYAVESQEYFNSFNGLQGTVTCQNGLEPSITCNDPSVAQENCNCICPNGVRFQKPFNSFISGLDTSATYGREQELLKTINEVRQQLKIREEQLEAQLSKCSQEKLDQGQEFATQLQLCRDTSAQHDLESATQLSLCKAKLPHEYIGCYTDTNDRALADKYLESESAMTIEMCAKTCKGYKYYGLQDYRQCFCGNIIKSFSKKVDEKECDRNCKGDNQQKCGGAWRLSVYEKV